MELPNTGISFSVTGLTCSCKNVKCTLPEHYSGLIDAVFIKNVYFCTSDLIRLPQNYKDKIINMKKTTLKMRNGKLKTTKTRLSKIKKKRTSKMKAKRKSKIKKKKRMSKMTKLE